MTGDKEQTTVVCKNKIMTFRNTEDSKGLIYLQKIQTSDTVLTVQKTMDINEAHTKSVTSTTNN